MPFLLLRYEPSKQSLQVPPSIPLYLPTSHSRHLILPPSVDQPFGQKEQLAWGIVEFRYRPVSHGLHKPPIPVAASPASHLVHLTLPSKDFSPKSHLWQKVELAFALFSLMLHNLQVGLPSSFWYSPGIQGKHEPLPTNSFLNPAGQSRHMSSLFGAPRYFPWLQSSHASVIEFSIPPAAQLLHEAEPFGLLRPRWQVRHLVVSCVPGGRYWLILHSLQSFTLSWPILLLTFPDGQSTV